MPEFPCEGPIDASIQTTSGVVHLIAENRSTVQVIVEPEHDKEESRAAADATRVEMNGNQLTIAVPKGSGFIRRRHSLRISVRLPLDSRIDVGSSSADVTMAGRFGSSEISTASGDLHVDEIAGDLDRHSASGDSEISRVTGSAKVETASGDLRITSVGTDLNVRSASGDVIVDAVGGSMKINTASGDVKVGSVHVGETTVSSASGDVQVGVAEGTAVWLDVNTLSGDTHSELAMGDGAPVDKPATLKLAVHTVSGDVLIRRAAPVAAGLTD